jgi:hypothetical protein
MRTFNWLIMLSMVAMSVAASGKDGSEKKRVIKLISRLS